MKVLRIEMKQCCKF